jgi:hypothetical protein
MADKKRAEVRNSVLEGGEDADPLADLARIIGYGGRERLETVKDGFAPSAATSQSNVPAMADLEEELLREFALYDAPEADRSRATSLAESEPEDAEFHVLPADDATQPAAPSIADEIDEPAPVEQAAASAPPADGVSLAADPALTAAEALEAELAGYDDDTMPPTGGSAGQAVSELAEAAPEMVAPEIELDYPFAGPVPDIEAEAEAAVTAPAEDEEPVFAGPVPDMEISIEEPAFDGPVPDFDFDLEAEMEMAVAKDGDSAEPVFAGPVPDFDFGDDATMPLDVSEEPETFSDEALAGELELSLGALDLAPGDRAEPHSAFAEWKTGRLSGLPVAKEPMEPAWMPGSVLGASSLPEPEPVAAAVPHRVAAKPEPDPVAEVALRPALSVPQAAAADMADLELGLLEPKEDAPEVPAVSMAAERRETSVKAPAVESDAADLAMHDALLDRLLPWEREKTPVEAAAAPPLAPWEMPRQQPPTQEAPTTAPVSVVAPAVSDDLDFDAFEFDFNEAEIEAEVSRAVLSELSESTVTLPETSRVAELHEEPAELPFDPAQVTVSEDAVQAIGELQVPSLPAQESMPQTTTVSDFEYDIEAEMAELFEMDKRAKSRRAEPAQESSSPQDAFDMALEADILRSLSDPHPRGDMPPKLSVNTTESRPRGFAVSGNGARNAAVSAIVLLVGGLGAYLWFSGDATEMVASGEPLVIMADKTPVKEAPENPGGKQVPNQDKAVYDRVAGKGAADLKQDSLITAEEEPVNVTEKTLGDEPAPVEQDAASATGQGAVPTDARLQPGDQTQANELSSNPVLSPRKVKTMIVLPNGTLVAREEAPAAATTTTDQTGSGVSPDQKLVATELAPPAAADATVAETPAAASQAPQISAPIPTARPSDQPVNVVGTVSAAGKVIEPAKPAAVAPAAEQQVAAAAPAASAVPAGTYVIQIASLPSQAEAQKSYSNLSKKFSSVIGGRSVDIKKADIAGKGTYYRVRIVAGTKDQAVALCESYRSAGGSCLVSR